MGRPGEAGHEISVALVEEPAHRQVHDPLAVALSSELIERSHCRQRENANPNIAVRNESRLARFLSGPGVATDVEISVCCSPGIIRSLPGNRTEMRPVLMQGPAASEPGAGGGSPGTLTVDLDLPFQTVIVAGIMETPRTTASCQHGGGSQSVPVNCGQNW
jgi:hypothetical protein